MRASCWWASSRATRKTWPVVGPAGKLLDAVLARERGPGARHRLRHQRRQALQMQTARQTPAQREVEACSHWLDEELDQVRPDIIIAQGSTASRPSRAMRTRPCAP